MFSGYNKIPPLIVKLFRSQLFAKSNRTKNNVKKKKEWIIATNCTMKLSKMRHEPCDGRFFSLHPWRMISFLRRSAGSFLDPSSTCSGSRGQLPGGSFLFLVRSSLSRVLSLWFVWKNKNSFPLLLMRSFPDEILETAVSIVLWRRQHASRQSS